MQCLTEIKIEDLAYRPTTTYLQRRRPRKRRRRVPLLHNSLNSIGEPTVSEDPEKKQLLYIHRSRERQAQRYFRSRTSEKDEFPLSSCTKQAALLPSPPRATTIIYTRTINWQDGFPVSSSTEYADSLYLLPLQL